jgi:hypothetical protein
MASILRRACDFCFRRQEYRVDGESQPRMIKWTLISTPLFNMFFHQFSGPDWTRDPHDHPTDFVSIGLKGSYVETVYQKGGERLYDREWRAPWIRKFPATHLHRTTSVGPKGAYTICLTSPWRQHWGFFIDGHMVSWRDYVKLHRAERADRNKAA